MIRPTIVIRKQVSEKYMLQIYDNGVMIKKEIDFDTAKAASKRAEEIIEEEENNEASP